MYTREYDSPEIRSDYNAFVQRVIPLLHEDMKIADLGCGTCRKTVQLSEYVRQIDCVDCSDAMLEAARHNILRADCRNMHVYQGDNFHVPLHDHSYEMVLAALTFWSAAEIHRLLVKGGMLCIEALCMDDKRELKETFGKDAQGYRGLFLGRSREEGIEALMNDLKPYFEIKEFWVDEFATTLGKNGLIKLLEQTPTIRNFSRKDDQAVIDSLICDGRVTFMERRMFIAAMAK